MHEIKKAIEKRMKSESVGFFSHLALYPLSLVYGAAAVARGLLYSSGVFKSARLSCRVISIGNITVGGTGKTPVTILVAEFLRKKGKRAVILSRGYKRKGSGVAVVSDLNGVLLGSGEAGDEPYLMATRLPGVPVVVGADRVKTGGFAIEKFSPDFIILDDGFQHLRLKRDLNILLVDGVEGFGSGYLLPRGVLREPLGRIKRADVVFVKGKKLKNSAADALKKHSLPALHFSYRPASVVDPDGGVRDTGFLKGKRAVAVAGLANPGSFFATLEELGVAVVKRLVFSDHHSYTSADLERIKKEASGADIIVTTEKDWVKLKGVAQDIPLYCLSIEAVFEEKDKRDFEDLIAPLLKGGR